MPLPSPPQTIINDSGSPGPQATTNPSEQQEFGQEAVVRIGTIDNTDNNSLYNFPTLDQNIFTSYVIRNHYESDKHIYMMPISSPNGFSPQGGLNQGGGNTNPGGGTIINNQQGNTAAFVQLASPTLIWIADWTASKYNSQPDIPDPHNVIDSNWVLLDELYETGTIVLAGDGFTPLYRISGTFVFGHLNPSQQVLNNIAFGRPPFLFDVIDRSMPSSNQKQRIIDFDIQFSTGLIGGPGVALDGGAFGAGS